MKLDTPTSGSELTAEAVAVLEASRTAVPPTFVRDLFGRVPREDLAAYSAQALADLAIAAYEHDLLDYAQAGLADIKGLRLIGTAREKASVMSFTIDGLENEAVAHHLDRHGVAVRSGHHCALPALRRFGVETTVRASLAFYNTFDEIDRLADAIARLAGRRQAA